MFTMLILWALDAQIPNWMIPVAAIVGLGAIAYAAWDTAKK